MPVYEVPTALESALPEEEIQKHVRLMQYQFRVFKNMDSFMSLRRRYLDKAVKKTRTPQAKIFFRVQSIRLADPFEPLNSSLAQSAEELGHW